MAQTVQILRTTTNNPPAALLPGALSAELGTQTKLWVGAGGGNRLLLSSDPADASAVGSAFLKLTGGTMTGPIALPSNPTLALQATTKQYVDAADTALAAADTSIRNTYLPLVGGTSTGPLVLAADPSLALGAATKQYVDVRAGATVAATAPTSVPGTLWFDSTGGQLYCRYDDGTSVQWVVANSLAGLANVALKTDVAAAYNNVGRNTLHNPLFIMSQRTGPWTVNGYTLDRWKIAIDTDTVSISRAALTDADRTAIGDEAAWYSLQNVFTGSAAATALNFLVQPIEDVRRLAGKTVTISFWAKAASGTPKLGINMNQDFGSGGSPSPSLWVLPTGNTVTLSTNWARYSTTITVPSITGKTLGTNNNHNTYPAFFYSCGATNNALAGNIGVQSGTIQLWGVQLEVGGTMTALEKPDPQQDLAKCQRFYQVIPYISMIANNTTSTPIGQSIIYPQMRAAPTAVLSNITYNNTSNLQVTGGGSVTASSTLVYASVVASGSAQWSTAMTLSADL